jgi:hypothetical protein
MTTTVEYGYLGSTSTESGAGISRLPTLAASGAPIYQPAIEGAWSRELLAPDGRMRFAKAGNTSGRGAANALDAVLADNFTILCLARSTTGADLSILAAKGTYGVDNFIGLYVTGSPGYGPIASVKYGAGANAITKSPAVARRRNDWQWCAMTRAGTVLNVFADGLKTPGVDATGTTLANTGVFSFQHNNGAQLACALVFNRVLSDVEIRSIMSGTTLPLTVPGLMGYYKFNEASGTQCTDYSGRGNHLTYNTDFATLQEEWAPDGNLVRDPGFLTNNTGIWSGSAGFSLGGGKLSLNNAASSSGVAQLASQIVAGNKYRVTFTIANYVSGNVRIILYGSGCNQLTSQRTANGTYTEDIVISNSGGSYANSIRIQAGLAGTTLDVQNLSVIPLTNFDGASGQPFGLRQRRNASNWWDRMPLAVAAPGAMGAAAANNPAPRLTIPPAFALNGDFTFCIKVKLAAAALHSLSYGFNTTYAGVSIFINDMNKFKVTWGDGTTYASLVLPTLSRPLPANAWVDLQIQRAGDFLALYINNVLASSISGMVQPATAAAAGLLYPTLSTPGLSRSSRWFSRAITAAEREAIFLTDSCINASGLLGEWLSNDLTQTRPLDTSGNGNHTTAGSSRAVLDSPHAMPRPKRVGKQLAVPGNSRFIVTGLPVLFHGKQFVTMTGWSRCPCIKFQPPMLNVRNVSVNQEFIRLHHASNGQPQLVIARAGIDVPTYSSNFGPVSVEAEWHYWGIEYDCVAKVAQLYKDGVLFGRISIPAASTGTGFDMTTDGSTMSTQFGVAFVNNSNLNGSYVAQDDLRLYARALTPTEHYQSYLGKAPRSGLLAEYIFDNDTTQCLDSSGNGFHGTWANLSLANYISQP